LLSRPKVVVETEAELFSHVNFRVTREEPRRRGQEYGRSGQ
jgi:hypothetical protein